MVLRYINDYRLVKGKLKEVSLNPYAVSLKQDYLDVLEGIKKEVINTAKYDENCGTRTI